MEIYHNCRSGGKFTKLHRVVDVENAVVHVAAHDFTDVILLMCRKDLIRKH